MSNDYITIVESSLSSNKVIYVGDNESIVAQSEVTDHE